jgi:hypothetical protein
MKKPLTFLFIAIFFAFLNPAFTYADTDINPSLVCAEFHNNTNGQYWNHCNNRLATVLLSTKYAINYTASANVITLRSNKERSIELGYRNPLKTFSILWFNAHGKYITGKIFEVEKDILFINKNTDYFNGSRFASSVYLNASASEKKRKQTLRLSKE